MFSFRRVQKLPPQVAYKKAVLLAPVVRAHFQGVGVNYKYSADAEKEAHTRGFHAYSTFKEARAHEQEGNVLLEVVLAGSIRRKTHGFVADHQRVLQVIPYHCQAHPGGYGAYPELGCQKLPTSYSLRDDELMFFCHQHAGAPQKYTVAEAPARVLNFITPTPKQEVVWTVGPLQHLPTLLPWLSEHSIVVAPLIGPARFRPTVLG